MTFANSIDSFRMRSTRIFLLTSQQFVWALYPLIFLDTANTVLLGTGAAFFRVSIFYRAFIELVILISFVSEEGFRKQYVLMVSLLFCFLVGHFVLFLSYPELDISEAFIRLNKYLFFIILSLPFFFFENDEVFTQEIHKLFRFFFILNSLIILLGLVFNIKIFSSYYDPANVNEQVLPRFGFKGLIPAQNELTGVYFFGLAYFFRLRYRFKVKNSAAFVLVVVASLLTGTKGCMFSVLSLAVLYLFVYRRKILVRLYFPVAALVAIYWGGDLIAYLSQNVFSSLAYFYQQDKLVTFLLTGRDVKLAKCLDYVHQYWTAPNYIFGGFDLERVNTEMDLIDIYFFWGIAAVPFLYYYVRTFFHQELSAERLMVFSIYAIIFIAGGHMLGSAIVPLFLLIYVFTGERQSSLKKRPALAI